LEGAPRVFSAPEAVLLTRERQISHRQSLRLERGHHALGLARRHDAIVEPLEDDDRARQPIDRVNRRALSIELARLWVRADQALEIGRLEFVRVGGQRFKIADAVVAGAGAKDVAERQGAQRCVAASAAATNEQATLIDLSTTCQVLRAVYAVVDVGDAPLS